MCSRPLTHAHLEILMWPLFALLSSSNLNNNSHIQLRLMWNTLANAWNECNANLMSFCSSKRNSSQNSNSKAIIQSNVERTWSTVQRSCKRWRGREWVARRPYKGQSLPAWHKNLGWLANMKTLRWLCELNCWQLIASWSSVFLQELEGTHCWTPVS